VGGAHHFRFFQRHVKAGHGDILLPGLGSFGIVA
jgi:hypothetical protein